MQHQAHLRHHLIAEESLESLEPAFGYTQLTTELARAHAPSDLPLAFAYLAASSADPSAVEEFFEQAAASASNVKESGEGRWEVENWQLAACYYFALRALVYLLPSGRSSTFASSVLFPSVLWLSAPALATS